MNNNNNHNNHNNQYRRTNRNDYYEHDYDRGNQQQNVNQNQNQQYQHDYPPRRVFRVADGREYKGRVYDVNGKPITEDSYLHDHEPPYFDQYGDEVYYEDLNKNRNFEQPQNMNDQPKEKENSKGMAIFGITVIILAIIIATD